ncbi:MAG TPA: hypothetical protein PKK43_16620 [Spirochaetota bacterium]|nr:hypothetical protein [Spirochaetota bacterium]
MRNGYEGTGFKEKLKEFGVLITFIFIAAFLSLVTMNILVFPVSLFAVKSSSLFTLIVKILIILSVLSYILFRVIRRIRISRSEEIPVIKAFLSSLSGKSKTLLLTILIIISLLIFSLILFFAVRYNYIILYELSQ